MSILKKIFIIFVLAILVIPASVSAFWFWDKPAAKVNAPLNNQIAELTPAEKEVANSKYKIWYDSFEKKDIQSVIDNQNNFSFSIAELNYLFNSESSKIKDPLLSNFKLTNNNGLLSVSADFKKIIKGNFSFNVQIVNDGNKIKLSPGKLRLYGFPIPASLISGSLNRSLDEYFSFLYQDARYQGFTFSNNSGILKLKPEFK